MQGEMVKNNRNTTNYNAVDLAKFICAIMIVAIHIAPFGLNDSLICTLLNYGIQQCFARIAVPFFFVASGFFLYRKSSYNEFSVGTTKKYVLKLLRLYIIWTIIYFPQKIGDIINHRNGITYGILEYIRRTIFTGSYVQLWYFPATIFAVILISLLISRKINIKAILIIATFLYALGLLAQSWFGIITPLRNLTPQLWSLLKAVQKVIGTTRDGLFEGFLFVGIGGIIAYNGFNITRKKALIGFIISYILMLFEVYFVTHFNILREHDMYIFLVPLAYFAFGLAINLQLPDKKIYKTLRMLSSLIFYIHLWVMWFNQKMFNLLGINVGRTCLLFILTVLLSIICSLIITRLSNIKNFRWLKKLYS